MNRRGLDTVGCCVNGGLANDPSPSPQPSPKAAAFIVSMLADFPFFGIMPLVFGV
jgi:hypothetical protein